MEQKARDDANRYHAGQDYADLSTVILRAQRLPLSSRLLSRRNNLKENWGARVMAGGA